MKPNTRFLLTLALVLLQPHGMGFGQEKIKKSVGIKGLGSKGCKDPEVAGDKTIASGIHGDVSPLRFLALGGVHPH